MFAFTPIPSLPFGPWEISTHGLLIAAGFLTAEILARRKAKARGLSAELVDNAAVVAVVAGLIGARLFYIIFLGRGMGIVEMLEVWKGGLSSHGGYLFGIIFGLGYLRYKKANFVAYADAVLPYLLVGWAIGRIGCFLNWDSFGKITSAAWAVTVYAEPRHPTQLYESLGYLLVFAIVFKVQALPFWRETRRAGAAAALALAGFALTRFVVDFWRDDVAAYLIMSRAVTIVIAVAALGHVFRIKKKPSVV